MSDSCTRCSALQTEIGRLAAVVAVQVRRIEWLTRKLSQLRAAVSATVAVMNAENEHTTMPRHQLLAGVFERLQSALIDLDTR